MTSALELRYKSFFDHTLDGFSYCQMLFDPSGQPVDFKYLEVNKNFETLTGLKKVVGKKITELIPGIATSNPELFELCGKVALTGESQRFELHIKSLEQWFFISAYQPRLKFFVAILRNITDRKLIEQNLENANIAAQNVLEDLSIEKSKVETARAKEEAILLSIGDGLLATDEQGQIILVNAAAETLLGKTSGEVSGKISSDIVRIEDEKGIPIPPEKHPIRMALATGTTTTTTTTGPAYYYVRHDGSKFPVAIMVTPVVLEGKVIGTIEVFRDITKEKEVDRAKTEFVSLASHQLRTPLSSIRWYAEMLLDGDAGIVTEKQKHYLEEIQRGNLRMIELVNTLLNVSRLELGTARMHIERVELATVVADVLQDLELRRQTGRISVQVEIPQTLPALSTDSDLIRMVVENLLSNAIKYTEASGTVVVEAEEVRANALFAGRRAGVHSIGFAVRDSGIGISALDHDQIFQKLFRTDSARTIDADGAGLGLYLTRLVLERMHGQIWFDSQVGKGTSFQVLFPCTLESTP